MPATIIDGHAIAERIHSQTKQRVDTLKAQGITPKLAVVLIGDDQASKTYVKKKGEAAQSLGMDFSLARFPADIAKEDLIAEIHAIQTDSTLSGLIVQLPVPEDFYPDVLNEIKPEYDVDCLTYTNLGKIVMQTNTIAPPTPGAVMDVLEDLDANLEGKDVAVVGTGVLVGKPLTIMLMNKGATVHTCNLYTKNISAITRNADIVISGVGKKHIITADKIAEGAIVIDAGVDFEKGHMFGDVDVDGVRYIASHVTPTPGGIGPLTVAKLMANTVTLAYEQADIDQ